MALRGPDPEKASLWLIEMGADIMAEAGDAENPISVPVLAWYFCQPIFELLQPRLLQLLPDFTFTLSWTNWLVWNWGDTDTVTNWKRQFIYAVLNGDMRIINQLVDFRDNNGQQAVHPLAGSGAFYLLKFHEKILMNACNEGRRSIHYALHRQKHPVVLEELFNDCALVDAYYNEARQPIHHVLQNQNPRILEFVLAWSIQCVLGTKSRSLLDSWESYRVFHKCAMLR